MTSTETLENRITELEIQTALQEDLLQSLNDTVARMQQTLDLQQAQLRLLYARLEDKSLSDKPNGQANEAPPHY